MLTADLPVYLIHYGAPDWCAAACASVLASTDVTVDLTVVHNGPPGCVLALPAGTRVIDTGHNTGYAGGANLAIADWRRRHAESPLLCVCAHDVQLARRTLRRLLDVAASEPDFGILGPELLLGDLTAPADRRAWVDADVSPGPVADVPYVRGLCLLLRRELVDELGGFDEDMWTYTEDADLSLRAVDAGFRVGVAIGARAHDIGHQSGRSVAMAEANWVYLALKRGGLVAGCRRYGRVVLGVVRSATGALAPWRPAGARAASRRRAGQLLSAAATVRWRAGLAAHRSSPRTSR